MKNNYFDFHRTYRFLIRQLIFGQSAILMALAAVGGPLLFIAFFFSYFTKQSAVGLNGLFIAGMFFGGYLFSSKIFWELQSPQKSFAYLALPVSTLEKLLVSWFLSSPMFVLTFSLFLFLVHLVSNAVTGHEISLLQVFDSHYLESIGIYMSTQTLFLLGACRFRKNNFLKTVLSIFGFHLLTLFYAVTLAYLAFKKTASGDYNYTMDWTTYEDWNGGFLIIPAIGIFFLIVSYFTLKEREV